MCRSVIDFSNIPVLPSFRERYPNETYFTDCIDNAIYEDLSSSNSRYRVRIDWKKSTFPYLILENGRNETSISKNDLLFTSFISFLTIKC